MMTEIEYDFWKLGMVLLFICFWAVIVGLVVMIYRIVKAQNRDRQSRIESPDSSAESEPPLVNSVKAARECHDLSRMLKPWKQVRLPPRKY